jgi:hypothetical protein
MGGMNSQRILAIGAGLATPLGIYVLYRFPPETAGFYPKCPLNWLTGGRIHCPGCGATRCLHALLHGSLEQALAYNAIFVLFLPITLYYFFRIWYGMLTGRSLPPEQVPRWALLSMFAVIFLFGILRNLPFDPFQWLAPHTL